MVKSKTKSTESINKITEREINAVNSQDKIAKLEKERDKNKRAIEEFKEREKATARALVLYERKIKYLKENAVGSLLALTKHIEVMKQNYISSCENLGQSELRQSFSAHGEKFDEISNKIYDVCNALEKNSGITNEERAFISNKKVSPEPVETDINSRFNRLKEEFDQKIGASVLRKPGRPKKGEQSIVADIGIGKRTSKASAAKDEAREKLNKIFYETPSGKEVVSNIPKTSDSVFDFDEALNPNISLKDIMADLMEEKEETPAKTYSKVNLGLEKNQPVVGSNDSAAMRKARVERLEAGIFQLPIFHDKKEAPEKVEEKKPQKSAFEQRFMPFKDITGE